MLKAAFDAVPDGRLLAELWLPRATSRQGHPLRPLWRAYMASFVLNMVSTNDLIRRLESDPPLRRACGFAGRLPHRTTFNRFIRRLAKHADLVEQCSTMVMNHLRELLPDLGGEIAIDSTTVRTYGNPNRRTVSDPEAAWTKKNSPRARGSDGKESHYGYKLHMVADANHGIPLAVKVTPANRSDSPELPALVDKARSAFPWCRPRAAMADRGYDAMVNYEHLYRQGTVPIILIRESSRTRLYDGVYTKEGIPTCMGRMAMEYVCSESTRGHLYRCAGCHLLGHQMANGEFFCQDQVWEAPTGDLRRFGVIPRASPEWKALYAKRQSIERTFKSLKQSRRLECHCVRGLQPVRLHCVMATLAYQMTVLVHTLQGETARMRWMVAKVD